MIDLAIETELYLDVINACEDHKIKACTINNLCKYLIREDKFVFSLPKNCNFLLQPQTNLTPSCEISLRVTLSGKIANSTNGVLSHAAQVTIAEVAIANNCHVLYLNHSAHAVSQTHPSLLQNFIHFTYFRGHAHSAKTLNSYITMIIKSEGLVFRLMVIPFG